jgi:ABC-type branched-subunit amino acid transport system permease subunit
MSVHQAWGIYNSHVHTNHPQYERWNKRISLNYVITVILAVAIPAVVFQIISIDVARLLSVLFWVLALAVGAAIFVVQRKGRERFRDLWNEEHGSPIDPH